MANKTKSKPGNTPETVLQRIKSKILSLREEITILVNQHDALQKEIKENWRTPKQENQINLSSLNVQIEGANEEFKALKAQEYEAETKLMLQQLEQSWIEFDKANQDFIKQDEILTQAKEALRRMSGLRQIKHGIRRQHESALYNRGFTQKQVSAMRQQYKKDYGID